MSALHDAAVSGPVPRPPWSWARVVKACRALSPRAKLVWLEHYGLWVTRSGCTASAAALGRRISTSQAAVERRRSIWLHRGAAGGPPVSGGVPASRGPHIDAAPRRPRRSVRSHHVRGSPRPGVGKHDRGPGRCGEWRTTLPLPCRPPSARITDDQCTALAQQLGAYITYRLDAARSALMIKRVPPISARLAPPTEMRALPPHSSEGGLLYQEVSVAGDAGEAGDAGLSLKEGLRGNVQNVHAEAESEPPAWFTDQPVYMQPPEPDDLTDEGLDSP